MFTVAIFDGIKEPDMGHYRFFNIEASAQSNHADAQTKSVSH